MSVVLFYLNENQIFAMSDGRARGAINDENYKKIQRINEKVCIGYTGIKEDCEAVINYIFTNGNVDLLTYNEIFDLSFHASKEVFNIRKGKILMGIAGINGKNQVVLRTFKSIDGFQIEEHMAKNGDAKFACFTSEIINAGDTIFYNALMAHMPLTNTSNIWKAMEETVDSIADRDSSVNKVKFREFITK